MFNSSSCGKRVITLAVTLTALGCAEDATNPLARTTHQARASATQLPAQGQPVTLDDHFGEIAKQLPAFAGMFQRGDSLIVALTDVSSSALVARSVIPAYTASHRIDGIVAPNRLQMGFVQVANNFGTLRQWYDRLSADGVPAEVTSVDINEQINRLTLGVASTAHEASVRAVMRIRGFPDAVLSTEIVPTPVPAQYLGDYIRPLVGGIKIQTNHLGTGKTGTLGFTAYKLVGGLNDSSTKYILTVSHITATQFGYDGAAFFQPDASYSQFADTVGSEVLDPPLFTGSPCPSGKMCRYSEAALVQVRPGVSWFHGAVAGSTAVTPPNPAPYTTTYLHHTNNSGQTTGVTYKTGLITGTTGSSAGATCVDIPFSTVPNSWLKCQWRTNATAREGDSGAPVYAVDYWAGWYVLYPMGILHSVNSPTYTQFWYSPLSGVYQDFAMSFETRTTCNWWNPPYCTW